MADRSISPSARRRDHGVRLGRITMIVLAALVLTAMSVGTASAGSIQGFQEPTCEQGFSWVPAEESCVANAPVVVAPVDACPDEALNPGVQAAGPCAVAAATVPDEAFVDPAIDVERTATTLALGASNAPVDAGASPEVIVATAAGAGAAGPAVASGTAPTGTGSLPYTGLSNSSIFAIGMLAILFGALAYGEAGRSTRRREVRTGA